MSASGHRVKSTKNSNTAPLNRDEIIVRLGDALSKYDYPKVAFDFRRNRQVDFASYRQLELSIRRQLRSRQPHVVKDGLSNVLFWGYATSPGRQTSRVKRFRDEVGIAQIERFIRAVQGPLSLTAIKACELPQFSGISFISKVLMFLDPVRYVTLDLQLAKIKRTKTATKFSALSVSPTALRVTAGNEAFYLWWCLACASLARKYFTGTTAADVERGFFGLVRTGNAELAAQLLEAVDDC